MVLRTCLIGVCGRAVSDDFAMRFVRSAKEGAIVDRSGGEGLSFVVVIMKDVPRRGRAAKRAAIDETRVNGRCSAYAQGRAQSGFESRYVMVVS